MNYFDIRKLQSALSMIKVAFVKANLPLSNIDVQSILKSIPSLSLSSDTVNGVEKLSAELMPATPVGVQLTQEQLKANLASLLKASTGASIKTSIKTSTDIDDTVVDAVYTSMINAGVSDKADIQNVSTAILDVLHADPANKTSLYMNLDDIVGMVFAAMHADMSKYNVDVALSDVIAQVYDWIGVGLYDLVNVVDFGTTGHIYDECHFEPDELSEKLNIRKTILDLGANGGMNLAGLKLKVLGVDELVLTLSSSIQTGAKIYSELKAKTIAQIFDSASLSGEMSLGFSIDDKLSLAVATALLSQIGVTAGFTIAPNNSDSSKMTLTPLKIDDMFKDVCASYGISQDFGSAIDVALKIVAKADMDVKDNAPFEPNKYLTSGTLCVVLGDIETIAMIALFKSVFGTQAKASLGESKTSGVDEEMNMNLSTKILMCTSAKIESMFDSACKITASVGFDITKYISDYVNTSLREMKTKTLGQLCVERVN